MRMLLLLLLLVPSAARQLHSVPATGKSGIAVVEDDGLLLRRALLQNAGCGGLAYTVESWPEGFIARVSGVAQGMVIEMTLPSGYSVVSSWNSAYEDLGNSSFRFTAQHSGFGFQGSGGSLEMGQLVYSCDGSTLPPTDAPTGAPTEAPAPTAPTSSPSPAPTALGSSGVTLTPVATSGPGGDVVTFLANPSATPSGSNAADSPGLRSAAPSEGSDDDDDSSKAWIAAPVVLGVVAILAVLAFVLYIRRRKPSERSASSSPTAPLSPGCDHAAAQAAPAAAGDTDSWAQVPPSPEFNTPTADASPKADAPASPGLMTPISSQGGTPASPSLPFFSLPVTVEEDAANAQDESLVKVTIDPDGNVLIKPRAAEV